MKRSTDWLTPGLSPSDVETSEDFAMKRKTIGLAFALALLSSAATAQERAGDAALGAVSGAVVLGPVGALAGAFVGYTAGPSIANAWGARRSSHRRYARRPAAAAEPAVSRRENGPAPRSHADVATVASAPPAPPPTPAKETAMPPVQPRRQPPRNKAPVPDPGAGSRGREHAFRPRPPWRSTLLPPEVKSC